MKKISTLFLFILFLQQFASSQVFIPFSYWAGTPAPSLSISDGATYNFGTNAVNITLEKTFTVTNASTAGIANIITGGAFALPTKYAFKDGTYPGTGGTCTTTLSPGESCTIIVTAISTTGGTFNDTVTLNYKNARNQGSYSATRAITGTFTTTPTILAFIAPSFVKVNDCQAISVQSQDGNGNPLNVTANTDVTFTINTAINTTLYSDSGCSTSITPTPGKTTINAASNTKTFYMKSTTANQSGILTGDDTAPNTLTTANYYFTITNAPTKLKLIAAPQIKTSTCATLSVNTVDSNNYNSNTGSNVTVNLTTNGSNTYYSDSGCSSSITSTMISSGTYSKTFYTRKNDVGVVTATATDNAAILTSSDASINFLDSLDWWNESWARRKAIFINNTDQAASFDNQQVLVVLNSSNVNYSDFKADGSDMRFVLAAYPGPTYTVLNHEIEKWNYGGTSQIWVRIPTINASSDTGYFYMYYKNPAAPDAQNKTGTWTKANLWSVWHFNEDPAGAAPQYLDATANARNGTANGTAKPTQTTGIIGYAAGLYGADDYIQINQDLSPALGKSSTLSVWFKTTQTNSVGTVTNSPCLMGSDVGGSGDDMFIGYISTSNTNKIGYKAKNGSEAVSEFIINNGAWRYVTMSRNSATGAVNFYINGVKQTTSPTTAAGDTAGFFDRIGDNTGAKNYNGEVDEMRIYTKVLTDDEVKADYKYMMNTHLLYNTTEVWP